MNLPLPISNRLQWFLHVASFFKKHFIVLFGLGLIAALGRVIQLGGFSAIPIPIWTNILVEVMVESARIFIFLYVLGLASIKNGILRIIRLFTLKNNLKINWHVAIRKLKKQWFEIVLNMIVFLVITWTINYLIELLAYETCLYLTLKKDGILMDPSSEWTIILFFKNITVIPFTLTFEAIFLIWITNKLRSQTAPII